MCGRVGRLCECFGGGHDARSVGLEHLQQGCAQGSRVCVHCRACRWLVCRQSVARFALLSHRFPSRYSLPMHNTPHATHAAAPDCHLFCCACTAHAPFSVAWSCHDHITRRRRLRCGSPRSCLKTMTKKRTMKTKMTRTISGISLKRRNHLPEFKENSSKKKGKQYYGSDNQRRIYGTDYRKVPRS